MDVKKGGELNVRELDFHSRYIYLCALLFKVLHPFLRPLWNDFKCKYILTSESLYFSFHTTLWFSEYEEAFKE